MLYYVLCLISKRDMEEGEKTHPELKRGPHWRYISCTPSPGGDLNGIRR